LLFLKTGFAFSQNNLLYLLRETPQSIALNPANSLQCNAYFGIPALSAFQYNFASSSFAYSDFIHQGTGTKSDSLIFDYQGISSQVKKNNFVNNYLSLVWFDMGIRHKKSYFSFTIKSTASFNLFYTRDLIDVISGNWNSQTDQALSFQLANNKPELLAYTAFSGNMSKEINKQLRIGIRVSYLKGAMLLKAQKSDFEITTTENPLAITFAPDYIINASFPMTFNTDSLGKINNIKPVFASPLQNFLLNKNRGASVDLGIIYQLNKQLSLSASVLDLGFIYWKSNSRVLQTSGSYTFSGFDLNQYSSGITMSTEIRTLLKDSVKELFHYTNAQNSFLSALPVRSFFSAQYQVSKKLDVGTVTTLFFPGYAIFWQQSVSIRYKLNSFLNVSSGLSYMNRQITNLGVALVLYKKPVQFYISTDNLLFRFVKDTKTNYILPSKARALNLSFGLNLVFGCNKKDISKDNTICPAYF
jgi:hypothetical protein